jgi:hypothetical protein
MTKDEALKLIKIHDETGNIEDLVMAYNACKEALEQPAQEIDEIDKWIEKNLPLAKD